MRSSRPARAAAALLVAVLAGCGGGGGGGSQPGPGVSAPAPAPGPTVATTGLAVTATLASNKRLTLAWPASTWAGTASVLEDPDGAGPLPEAELAQVAATTGQATVEIFLPVALNARYRVAVCNGGSCVHSEPVALTGTLEAAMGFIKADQLVQNAQFGHAVALSRDGRVLAVGAIFETLDASFRQGVAGAGAVHLYEKTAAGSWVFRSRLVAPFPDDNDRFGSALALSADGSVLAVGSPASDAVGTADGGANNAGTQTGGVNVYQRQANTWLASAFVQGSGASDGDHFGNSLDLSDDGQTLAVGAYQLVNSPANDGRAFVFQQQNGVWTEQAALGSDNLVNLNRFGMSVALTADGNTLVVGAPGDASAGIGVFSAPLTDAGAPSTGAVHVFQRSAGVWARTAFVKGAINTGAPRFGEAVDISADGQTMLVGAPRADLDASGTFTATDTNSGAAFVFTASAGTWVQAAALGAPVPANDDFFGDRVSLSGNAGTAAVGTRLQDDAGVGVGGTGPAVRLSQFGAAYAFTVNGADWGPAVVLKPSDPINSEGGWHGQSVALSGDGKTLAVGASMHDGEGSGIQSDPTLDQNTTTPNSGAVYLY